MVDDHGIANTPYRVKRVKELPVKSGRRLGEASANDYLEKGWVLLAICEVGSDSYYVLGWVNDGEPAELSREDLSKKFAESWGQIRDNED